MRVVPARLAAILSMGAESKILSRKTGMFFRNGTFSLRYIEMAPKKTFLSRPDSTVDSSGGRYKGIAEAFVPGTFRIARR